MSIANTQSVEIKASPERVWQVITDFSEFPAWNPMTPGMKGELREGARLKGKLGLGPATVPFFPTLLTVEPNVELRWKGGVPGAFVADHRFIIEPVDETTTLLRHHEVFTGAFKPVGPLKAVPDRVHAGFNSALKRRAESTAGR
ncbi:MAG: SRPBCC domain-containing protein [Thermoleophilaceae bacterium]|nr:SRPBCC domain-containing protein [Thermoleophilaceae bacterium]